MRYSFTIAPASRHMDAIIQQHIDGKTKPQGALGQLERVAAQLARIQASLNIQLGPLHHLVFAADHGVCAQGVSPYPSEVTRQMVTNFCNGGAAINVFCRQQDINMTVVDAGIRGDSLPPHPNLLDHRIAEGTADFTAEPAMTPEQCLSAVEFGAELARMKLAEGSSVLSFGEMGIGNTTAGAALMAACLKIPPHDCVGRGTGANDAMLVHKAEVVEQALVRHRDQLTSGAAIMQHLGGLELAMMAGAMAATAEVGKVILVDGFLASTALLTLWRDHPAILDYCVFSHLSVEKAHHSLLLALDVEPLLQLDLRLGEGSGAVLAWPLVQAAAAFFNDMASFADAGVSEQAPDEA